MTTQYDRARFVTPDRLQIEELWHEGKTVGEIAKRLGTTPQSIHTTMWHMRNAPDLWDLPIRGRWSGRASS